MAQRDYVGRSESSGTRRKKANSKKKRPSSGRFKKMIVLTVAVLMVFIGGLYFIAYNKSEEMMVVPDYSKHIGSELPSKPEERWHYIKELENRQLDVQTPTEPPAGGEMNSPAQLTNEQLQLLEQMQMDMRREPPHLNEVPYNDQSKSPVMSSAKEPQKEKIQRWLIQCGSFKTMNQAESVRAQLAFAGIESHIISGGGWNRVLLGPYSNRAYADKILQNVRGAEISNCILAAP